MTVVDKNKPVLVTGANGYVASWLVKRLLDEGLTVHAAVRDPHNEARVGHLRRLAEKNPKRLLFFAADLLREGSYDEAASGCSLVFHTASPFVLKVRDRQRDLIEPALQGTRNVLNTVDRTASVRRVVLTSSVAAIFGDGADILEYPGQTATEANWNTSSKPNYQAYSYSKTVAEREAWAIHDRQNRWQLVVVNPSMVIGPGLSAQISSESFNLIKQLGDGRAGMGVPDFQVGVVDVRDVAEAHFQAGFRPDAEGRHIVSADTVSFLDLARMLAERFGTAYPFPRRLASRWLVWLLAPFFGYERRMILRNVGYAWKIDNRKGIERLGLEYRPVRESVQEFFQQMVDSGAVKGKKGR